MLLNYKDGLRFFSLFNSLSIYAHERLRVVEDEEFWNGELPRGIGEAGQRETMHALWKKPSIIDDYVTQNPDGLSKADLRVVSSWKSGYHDVFYVTHTPAGDVVFFAENYVFVVCGLSKKIEDMLGALPAMVETTLLPYGQHIVYDQFMMPYPIDIGPNMRSSFDREMTEALSEGRLARTGKQLMQVAPQLERDREERRLEDFRRDIEMEERAAAPHEGQRESVLVGMDDEERHEAIMRHMREQDASRDVQSMEDAIKKVLDGWCTPGPLRSSLADLLADEEQSATDGLPTTEELLAELDRLYEASATTDDEGNVVYSDEVVEDYEKRRKLILEMGVPAYFAYELSNPASIETILGDLSLSELRSMKKLFQSAGSMRFVKDSITSLKSFPRPLRGICYLFRDGDSYQYVIPDKVYHVMEDVNWRRLELVAQSRMNLMHFVEEVLELRGIVSYPEVLAEFCEAYPDDLSAVEDLHEDLLDAMESDSVSAYLLATKERDYLLHFELMDLYLHDKGRKLVEAEVVEEGELTDDLKNLLNMQKGKEPRKLSPQMLAEDSVFSWKEKQPPARALRDFLDVHVPDEADEYYYADKILEELIEDAKWGIEKGSVDFFFHTLEYSGFVPDESQVQQLLNLWQNLCNGLPTWPNNGWSPNEMMGRKSSRRVFYNPDGSIMRVGRNDPCPCGSGKKYKRCHGR